MKLHLGTCAWTFDDWRSIFYPPLLPTADRLAYYARWFNAVEVDSTFYHPPPPPTAAHWAKVTPATFRFSCKMPRELTHERKLRLDDDARALLSGFLRSVEPLGEKLASILIQLPPWFTPKYDELALREFLHQLPRGIRWAVEFRDSAWHFPRIVHLLEHYGIAWVWNDLTPLPDADRAAFGFHPRTADFVMLRLLGDPATKYRTDGSRVHRYQRLQWPRTTSLNHWATKIRTENPPTALVFANNHFEGFSPETARRFAEQLGEILTLPTSDDLRAAQGSDDAQMRLW